MHPYLIRIFTSPRRGAGTTASVRVWSLAGTKASRGPFAWMRTGFPRGSVRDVSLELDEDLGELTSLEIGHDDVGDAGTGWLLQQVQVFGSSGEWTFPCERWLGASDSGAEDESGPTRVVLASPVSAGKRGATPGPSPAAERGPPLSSITTKAACVPAKAKVDAGKRGVVRATHGWAGEDAYFVSNDGTKFGVADGVSEWAARGVDAGLFSRALCEGAARGGGTLEAAAAHAAAAGVLGSSTMVVVDVSLRDALARVAVIGDSRAALVRGGRVVHASEEQEFRFGMPRQLSSEPAGNTPPSDALRYAWPLRAGDVLVAGTDGLFDNAALEAVARTVAANAARPAEAARALVSDAWAASQSKSRDTPYARAASEAYDLVVKGGKPDDITCVVGRVE